MSLIRHSVPVSGSLWDASMRNFTRWKLLQVSAHSPLALSQCLCLSTSSIHCLKALEKQQQRDPIGREATELSKFIDILCNPNALGKRLNDSSVNRKQVLGMNVAADSFLESLNLTKYNATDDAISQFSKEVYKMSNVQLIELLKATSKREIDHPALLGHICTALNDHSLPSPLLRIAQIAFYLSRHSFLDKPLLDRIKNEFLSCAKNEFISDLPLSYFAIAFAFFRLTDQRFWQQIIRTAEALANRLELQDNTLMKCINSLATANVHPKLVSFLVERGQKLEKDGMYSGRWLQIVHSMAILNSMDARMAESVLNRRFIENLSRQQREHGLSEHLAQWNSICYRNIATSALLELPKEEVPPIDDALLADADAKSFSLVRDIKRGDQKHHPLVERFELMLRLVAPLSSYSTPQEWHKTGAFLEGRCFVDTAQRQLIPLREFTENANVREIAVLLLMDRHFTQCIGPTDNGIDRPTGINQMNIRHLKLAGIHPIVFTERHFRKLGKDERAQIKFIREKILSLSEEFHTNEWGTEK